jgi:hypothetical protein
MSARAKGIGIHAPKARLATTTRPSCGVPDKSRSVLCVAIWWGADASGGEEGQ